MAPFTPFTNIYSRFDAWRTALDLPNPGTVENMQKEVKTVHLANFAFDGARADLTKVLSVQPAFQVTHSFALGSQTQQPSYNFGALYANQSTYLQGGVDHEGNVNARVNQAWSENNITKIQAQLSQQSGHNMFQAEQDIIGRDYSINAKVLNPWPTDLTGIYIGSYLQSVTKNLALGVETLFQHPAPDQYDVATSYLAKYTSTNRDWIATAQVQPSGIVQASYWHKLSEKVEVGADLQMIAAPVRRDAVATIGAKYDLRMSTFRAQVDSTGKVGAWLEQRFAPSFSFIVSGEIDHFKNQARVGVGVMIESSSLTPEEMGLVPQ